MYIKGKYNTAQIMTERIEASARDRVANMCNLDYLKDTNIVMMPDVHEGKGCAIGTTIKFDSKEKMKLSPFHIGVDIGCGMSMYPLGKLDEIDFVGLDKHINEKISTYPRSKEKNKEFWDMIASSKSVPYLLKFFIGSALGNVLKKEVINTSKSNIEKVATSIGTLGGGNHFIEIGKNDKDEYFLIVHTGSRFVGATIANHYQNIAIRNSNNVDIQPIIKELKEQDKEQLIQPTVELLKSLESDSKYNKEDCYLKGEDLDNYIDDQSTATFFALVNRQLITATILDFFGIEWNHVKHKDSPHNYIQDDIYTIVRKGACSAEKGNDVIIPINMRDGIIYGKGKGNPEWNYSAPHGAGRVLSRTKAKETLNISDFKDQMKDVFSTTITQDTLDEAPDAYKPMEEILAAIGDSVEVIDIIKPVYNFKGIENKKWWENK